LGRSVEASIPQDRCPVNHDFRDEALARHSPYYSGEHVTWIRLDGVISVAVWRDENIQVHVWNRWRHVNGESTRTIRIDGVSAWRSIALYNIAAYANRGQAVELALSVKDILTGHTFGHEAAARGCVPTLWPNI
jgi:hypothetical protein